MENRAFSQEDFAAWSDRAIPYLHISTRIDGKKDDGLFKEKGFRGFPSFCVMDANGDIVAKHVGSRDVAGFQKTLRKGETFISLREEAKNGDALAAMKLFVAQLELGQMNFASASLRFELHAGAMPERLRREARSHLNTLLFNEVQEQLRASLRMSENRADYLARYESTMTDLFRANRLPAGSAAYSVLSTVLQSARKKKDAELYAKALEVFKARFSKSRYARRIPGFEKALEELRGQ